MVDLTRLPKLKDLMYPICHFVDIDYYITGCPPMPFLILHTLKNILNGKEPLRYKSVVCTECSRKIFLSKISKLSGIYEKEADPKICLLSQGFVCLGSLTRNGCGAPCPRNGFTCFGCRGPPDSLLYRSGDLYSFLLETISRRTGISKETVGKELHRNPFIFHTFIFSKLSRFKSRRRII
jgi:F420-non-reducing hydrogenase small subunit